MKSTEHWLVHDHTQLENLLHECHQAADISDWWGVVHYFKELVDNLKLHMAREEEVLFPAYEKKASTSDMSSLEVFNEHSALVDQFRKLKSLIDRRDLKEVTECITAVELMLVNHNQNEEQKFLPFASMLLFDDREELQEALSDFSLSEGSRDWGITFKDEEQPEHQ